MVVCKGVDEEEVEPLDVTDTFMPGEKAYTLAHFINEKGRMAECELWKYERGEGYSLFSDDIYSSTVDSNKHNFWSWKKIREEGNYRFVWKLDGKIRMMEEFKVDDGEMVASE